MKKFIPFLLLFTAAAVCYSQSQLHVFQDWSTTAGTQNFFYKNIVKTDGSGNVYVSGATLNGSGNYDVLLSKYNSSGNLQWTRQYNGVANYQDFATALFVDGSGNVYITGAVTNDTVNHLSDLVIIKYNASGTQQWVYTYDGAAHSYDSGADLEVDGSGNVYATGSSYNASLNADVLVLKVNSSGTQQWASLYDYTSHLNDAGIKIKGGSTVTVTGLVQNTSTGYIMGALSFSGSTGTLTGASATGSGSTAMDVVGDMAEAGGYIYVAGGTPTMSNGYDCCIIKLDSYLNIVWQRTYDGAAHLDDQAKGLKVDAGGNVYVTGYSTTSTQGTNYVTQKYNSSGTLIWTQSYNDSLNGDDEAAALVLDNSGTHMYVTGSSYTDSLNGINYYTVKYDTAGTQQWAIAFDGDRHLKDKATNITIDTTGNVIVTGESETATGVYEYATIRYVEKQITLPTDYNLEKPQSSFLYFENKGQLIQSDSTPATSVRYYTNSPYPAYYFKENSMSMIFSQVDTILATVDTLQRIDMNFHQSNAFAKTYPLEEQPTYLNYFLAHCGAKGITEVHGNQRLITTDLYPDIDLVYSSNQNGFKYYFVVKPGGTPANIKMEYTGATSFNLDTTAHELTVNSDIGGITYDRPTVYQLDASNMVDSISGWHADWLSNGASNKYKFNIGSYDSTKVLVIEVDQGNSPFVSAVSTNENMEWSTFLGGAINDQARDVVCSPTNKVWVTGASSSNVFLAAAGTIGIAHSGYIDAFVAKFNNLAINNWITYYGGTNAETGMSIVVDKVENVYIVGKTNSTGIFNYASLGIDDATLQGAQDGFYVNLNAAGTGVLCDSYIGGAGGIYEVATGIALKESGATRDVYITGYTDDASGFPLVSSGAFNQSSIAGSTDGFIMKLNVSNNNQWCSLFGGAGGDVPSDIDMRSGNHNPVIVGHTTSSVYSSTACATPSGTGFPFCDNSGAYYSQAYGGFGGDDFIMEFGNASQNLVWSTFFGGTGNEFTFILPTNDACKSPAIVITSNDDVYMTGDCSFIGSTPTFPLLNSTNGGTYNQAWNTDTMNAYIARFNSGRQQTWTSFIGGNGNNLPLGICADPNNTVYITGWASASSVQSSGSYCTVAGSNNFPVCNYSGLNYLETNPTTSRMYIHAFDASDNIRWSTLFGQSAYAHGQGIAVNASKLFVTGLAELNYTLWDYDPGSALDYFKNSNPSDVDASITRFDITSVVIGINEHPEEDSGMNIFPNPSSNSISIEFTKELSSDFEVRISDIQGRVVLYKKCSKNEKNLKFDISGFSSGMYFIHVNSAETVSSGKFIRCK